MPPIRFTIDQQPVLVENTSPTTTLLDWLRATGRTGTKEGCAEGDCGACTVAFLDAEDRSGPRWRSGCSCLVLLPQVHGREIVTVEDLSDGDRLHPAQQALVGALGSQCGYCTPGFVMSLFEATYRDDLDQPWKKDDQLCGNLCRCTGYRPIRDALGMVAGACPADRFAERLEQAKATERALDYEATGQVFLQPGSFDALWAALEAHPEARIIAGATDLGLDVTKKGLHFPALISVLALPGIRGIKSRKGGWTIGAGTSLAELEAWSEEKQPILSRMLRFFASRQIKNLGTVGGNLCNASPIGDLPPALLALGASVVLQSRGGKRKLPLHDFFLSYRKTALQPGEILVAVELPRPPKGALQAAYKVSKRRELDISAVCAAFLVELDKGTVRSARLAYGGMAATPARALKTEARLVGRPWNAETVEEAARAIGDDFSPLSDHRGSAWYRGTVARNLLIGFFEETRKDPAPRLPDRPSGTVQLETAEEGR